MSLKSFLPDFVLERNRAHHWAPATADLTGMPPVMIHVGADELLLADSELVADRLAAAHASCELHVWSGQIHDFPLAAEILPEGRQAIGYMGDFVKGVTAAPAQSAA